MPLGCFGVHDWSEPFIMDNQWENYVMCLACGYQIRFYPYNMYNEVIRGGEVNTIQMHQQSWNNRPRKPFFDVPEDKKGWAG